jgi:gliding motility-associated-like protein
MLILGVFMHLNGLAQETNPVAIYTDDKGFERETNNIEDGQAPLTVTFRANPTKMGDWTPSFEWHFRKKSGSADFEEKLVRYEEDTQYTFTESGTFHVVLKTFLTRGTETAEADSNTVIVTIAESRLEMPNAFSPNNDGTNDVYQAKSGKDGSNGYRSIVEFHAYIFNRWGQKLFEWTDISKGWDGTYNGKPVKEGVYYVLVKAKGADGKEYNIRRDVNLLRGYTSESGNSTAKQ